MLVCHSVSFLICSSPLLLPLIKPGLITDLCALLPSPARSSLRASNDVHELLCCDDDTAFEHDDRARNAVHRPLAAIKHTRAWASSKQLPIIFSKPGSNAVRWTPSSLDLDEAAAAAAAAAATAAPEAHHHLSQCSSFHNISTLNQDDEDEVEEEALDSLIKLTSFTVCADRVIAIGNCSRPPSTDINHQTRG